MAPADSSHYIAPIEGPLTLETITSAVVQLGGRIVTSTDTTISATFETPIMRFVDDMAIALHAEKNIAHVYSASRVGHSDLNANRKRVEQLRSALTR